VNEPGLPASALAARRETLIDIAREAGAVILDVHASDSSVRGKDNASPVTVVDERAEALIVRRLQALQPRLPIVAEEAVAAGRAPEIGARFWFVDLLGGTRALAARWQFTVNIELVDDGVPALGVVLAPRSGARSPVARDGVQ
jgi:3'(2'), 5'-bisphosphate nucleotidase